MSDDGYDEDMGDDEMDYMDDSDAGDLDGSDEDAEYDAGAELHETKKASESDLGRSCHAKSQTLSSSPSDSTAAISNSFQAFDQGAARRMCLKGHLGPGHWQ